MKSPKILEFLGVSVFLTTAIVAAGIITQLQFIPTNAALAGLTNHWRFEEGTGTAASDSVDGVTGTLNGSPTWTTGKIGGGLRLDGVNDSVSLGTSSFGITNEYTITMWVEIVSGSASNAPRLFGRSAFVRPFAFDLQTSGVARGRFRTTSGVSSLSSSAALSNGWHHLALTFKSGDQRFYVDGTLVQQATVAELPVIATDQPVEIGTASDGSSIIFFNGGVDEVQIYNRALSGADVSTVYNETVATPPPPPTPDTSAPSVPTSLSATAVSASQINLSWNASTDNVGVTGYNIFRNGSLLTTTGLTSFQNSGLQPDTTHSYTVRAFDAAGNTSAQSSSASATTQSSSPAPAPTGSTFYIRPAGYKTCTVSTCNGADWNNAFGGFPTSAYVRGATYYVADGAYVTPRISAASGTQVISIKKATVTDHGTSTGWQTTFGDGQATFTGGFFIEASYITIDGQTGGGPGNWKGTVQPFGFYLYAALPHKGIQTTGSISNATIKHMEIEGNGPDGAPTYTTATGKVVGYANDLVYLNEGTAQFTNWHFTHMYLHDTGRTWMVWRRVNNAIVEYSYFARGDTSSAQHGNGVSSLSGSDNTWRYNIFEDGTGTSVMTWGSGDELTYPLGDRWQIYGNIFFDTGTWPLGRGQGVLSDWENQPSYDNKIYNNVFYHLRGAQNDVSFSEQVVPGVTPVASKVYNNIFYDISGSPQFAATVHAYNTYDTNWKPATLGSNEEAILSLSNNPFVNPTVTALDFSLKSSIVSSIAAGKNDLGAIFGQDLHGHARGSDGKWDRGAIEFSSTGTPPPTDNTAPSVPTNFAASVVSSTQINLSWTAATDNVGVTGYRVFRNGTLVTTVTGTSHQDTGLSAATNFTYTVAAIDAAGNASAQSSSVSATTQAVTDISAPSVPTNLAASVVSASQINLSWTAATDNIGVTGYQVFRNGSLITTVTGTSFQNTGLSPSTSFTYTVAAIDAAGNASAQSSSVSATTSAPTDTTAPTILNVSVSAITQTGASISFTTNEPAIGQISYGFTTSYGLTSSPTALATTHTVTLSGLSAGSTYHYRINATDGAGNLGQSIDRTFVTQAAVAIDTKKPQTIAGLQVANVTQTSVDLVTWTAPYQDFDNTTSGSVASYDIRYQVGTINFVSATQAAGEPTPTVPGTAQTYVLVGLTPGTTYQMAMTSRDSAGNISDQSNVVTFTTQSPTPTMVTLSVAKTGSGQGTITGSGINCGSDCSQAVSAGTAVGLSAAPAAGSVFTGWSGGGCSGTGSCNVTVNGNTSVTATFSPAPDTTAPTISAVTVTGTTHNSATVTWTTNEAADTQVDYGTTTAYGLVTALNTTLGTSHSASLSSLSASTLYHYRVRSRDAAGNLRTSADGTFTTAAAPAVTDTTAPVISGIQVTNKTATTMTIVWTTNEPATSKVDYGTTTAYGSSVTDSTLSAAHSLNLTNLQRKTSYFFRITSVDAAGNIAQVASPAQQTHNRFAKPPTVRNVSAAAGSVVLSWENPTEYEFFVKTVIFRRTNAYVVTPDLTYKVAETMASTWTDTNVQGGTTYYYTLFTIDDEGIYSDPEFITFTPPTSTTSGGIGSTPGGSPSGTGTAPGVIGTVADNTAPTTAAGFVATPAESQVSLTWTNPTDSDFVRVVVLRSEQPIVPANGIDNRDPHSISNATVVYEGSNQEFTDTNLVNGKTYYYAIYTYDRAPNYSAGVEIAVSPMVGVVSYTPPVAENTGDTDQDGLTDAEEVAYGTDPSNWDTDFDSFRDGIEVETNHDPLTPPTITKVNQTLINRLKGTIVLQVQQHGEAWYIHPVDGKRYYLRNGDVAYKVMRFLSLGITDADLAKVPVAGSGTQPNATIVNRTLGYILLQVQQRGEAWYVHPTRRTRTYLKDGQAAYDIMRLQSLGITDADLATIPIGTLLGKIR